MKIKCITCKKLFEQKKNERFCGCAKEHQKEYLSRLEVKEHRKEYQKEYHSRPEVKEHRKEIRNNYFNSYIKRLTA